MGLNLGVTFHNNDINGLFHSKTTNLHVYLHCEKFGSFNVCSQDPARERGTYDICLVELWHLKRLQDPMSPPSWPPTLGSPTTPSMSSLSVTLTSSQVSCSICYLRRSQVGGKGYELSPYWEDFSSSTFTHGRKV